MGSNYLSNSAPKGEVDRGKAPGRRGSTALDKRKSNAHP